MSQIAFYIGERGIHWSAIIITMGTLCCLSLTIALFRQRSESLRPILFYFPAATILGLLFARLIHWYFNTEIYGSLGAALSNFDLGSFSIPGLILGIWLAAWIVYRLELVPNSGMLLDCTAPGLALLIAFVRLSALFNNTCRSRIEIHRPLLKTLPFAVANTDAIKKANRKLKPEQITEKLAEAYAAGQKVVYSHTTKIAVRDTLFNGRQDFCIDSLKYIPFSGKEEVQMEATTKMVSGVPVPLFEARVPWKSLLKGMNNQLRINLDAESRDMNRYEGLQVGSITAPNNNAGNWE